MARSKHRLRRRADHDGPEPHESLARRVTPPVVLAVLVLASLGASLFAGFVWDDRPLIVENRLVKDRDDLGKIFTSSFWETGDRHDRFRSFYRPTIGVTYALDYALWGLNPFGFHLTNLIWHFLACWLVYLLARDEGLSLPASLAGASLFAVHPVHVESVAWISGRTDLVCAVFTLAAFRMYRISVRRGATRARTVASMVFFGLAMFSKEMAATLPLLVFLDRWIDTRQSRSRWQAAFAATWPFLAVLAIYFVFRMRVLGSDGEALYTLGPVAFLATSAFVLARYLTQLLLPVALDAHYPYGPLESLVSPVVLLSVGILLVVGLGARQLISRDGRGAFWLTWIFVGLLPVLTFGRFGDVIMADRFLYLPSVGLALLLACAWDAAERLIRGRRRTAGAVATAAVVALLGLATWQQSKIWRDDYTLFSTMARTSPNSSLVRCNLGMALYNLGRLDEAVEAYRHAIAAQPSFAMAHNNLGAALERQGQLRDSLRHYLKALDLAPDQLEARVNAGSLLVRLGNVERGLELLRQVVQLYPRYPNALVALANALHTTRNFDEALALLERAQQIDSDYPLTPYLLGKIKLAQGRHREAAEDMRRFLEVWPTDDEYASAARRVVAENGG